MMNTRNPKLKTGDTLHHFKIVRQEAIPKLQLVYYELEHETHGSRMVHLSSDDRNNVFMVVFPTHPTNSTGVAHILEHGVLEGSKNYPVRIYKNLSGRSLNTFLNAMTSSDYTGYPFASCNTKDFFNLMDVYMDATFFPLLQKNTFLQEGWRYEFSSDEDPSSPLEYRGVVYNEMKGAMSNPVRLFYESQKKALFPDLIYANTSGGNPAYIPDLTYEEWTGFHARFYHPSNAFFFTFGDIPLEKLTEKIHAKVMTHFKPSRPADPIPIQIPYNAPRRMRFTFPVSKHESTRNKSFVAVMWKLAPVSEVMENLRLGLLNILLAGDSSSILNRTLLGSGFGNGLAPIGFDTSFSESLFGAGLKDVDESNADSVETLIIDTLQSVAEKGFEETEIQAAIHELEFTSLEIKGDQGVPFGLSLIFRGMKVLVEGGDFAQTLKIHDYLDDLRNDAMQPGFFKDMMYRYLLDNPHRITMVLAPEAGGMEELETSRREKLDAVKEKLTEKETQLILEQTRELRKYQADEGDTSCLPKIELEDISPYPEKIPQHQTTIQDIPLYRHDIPTNGVTYMALNFRKPVSTAVPITAIQFADIISELGSAGRSYIEMSRLLKTHTGGVSINPYVSRDTNGEYWMNLQFSGRCLPRNHKAMMDLSADLLSEPDLSDRERIQELLNMQKAYALPMAAYQGHRIAMLAAGRNLSPLRLIDHHTAGIAGIQRLVSMKPDDLDDVTRSISAILAEFCRTSFESAALTGQKDTMDDAVRYLNRIHDRLYTKDNQNAGGGFNLFAESAAKPEAWVLSTDVSYVAQAFKAVHYEHPDAPVLTVLSKLMEKPMYERIRARGGAYGAFAVYDTTAGIYTMMTYRDPHTAQSLDAFGEVIKQLGAGEFTGEQLFQAIVNVISSIDTPPSPREKGLIAFKRVLNGITYDSVTQFRKGILNTNRDDIVRIIQSYLLNSSRTGIAMVTSDKILENNETKTLDLERKSLEEN
jgi:presequence protease